MLDDRQQEFIAYVMRNYVAEGIDELDLRKLSQIITAKYGSIHAAQESLGSVDQIKNIFVDFQQYLYADVAVG